MQGQGAFGLRGREDAGGLEARLAVRHGFGAGAQTAFGCNHAQETLCSIPLSLLVRPPPGDAAD